MNTEEANPRLSRVVELFNRFLTFFFGHLEGERRVWMHWQNLREDAKGNPHGFPWYGRAWIHIRAKSNQEIELNWEWNFWSHFCGLSFNVDNLEHGIQLHVAFPPVSLWFSVNGILSREWVRKRLGLSDREISLNIHDWSIYWMLWADPNIWTREIPRWKQGSFNLPNFFLGKLDHWETELSTHEVEIPLPEGNYPATVRLVDGVWKRQRWFARHLRLADVKMHKPAPFPGKGENSWDCGEDALYSLHCKAKTIEQAISAYVEAVLRNRRRYGGNAMMKYPPPIVEAH